MKLKVIAFVLVLLAGGAWLVAFTSQAVERENSAGRAPRPNILFILSDDQRPDTIHALGNSRIHTPHLDQLVRSGTVFTRALTANPLCVPSRAEILTGVSGFRNGVLPGISNELDPDLPLWPEVMRAAGYHTWYVGKWHTNGRPITRGYEETRALFVGGGVRVETPVAFDFLGRRVTGYRNWIFETDAREVLWEKGIGLTPDISTEFADAAIQFIKRERERPFFLHVNFTAPHDPLLMPPGYEKEYEPERMPLPVNFRSMHPFEFGNFWGRDERLFSWPRTAAEVRKELALYYLVISHMDEQIGRIVRALEETGQLSNTIVVFSSDHGLAVGSHGLHGKRNMYEHTVNVPMIVSGPSIPRGHRIDAQVYLRDLFPTVCDLVGLERPDTVEGRSWLPLLSGSTDQVDRYVFAYSSNTQRMIRGERWKLIHYPQIGKYQLFDLVEDPSELDNLADKAEERSLHAGIFEELKDRLKAWQEEVGDPAVGEASGPGAGRSEIGR